MRECIRCLNCCICAECEFCLNGGLCRWCLDLEEE